MAAYAALLSLMYIIKQIEHHPRPPISLDKTQVESLTEKVTFLQEFLEGYSLHVGYSKEADPLELRIADAAYGAEDVIESHIVDQILPSSTSSGEEISSVDLFEGLQKVIEDMDLLKKEVTEIKEKIGGVQHHLMQRSSTPVASFRSSSNMAMVGFDDVLIEVMDKLTRGQLDRQIIPIVGMGGIGKTTLARNVYQDQVIKQHFVILVWVTISQDYNIREILAQLLEEVGGSSSQMDDFNNLGDKLYKELLGRKYLIFLDDVWDIQAWDQLRRFFPNNNNGSRIVITTRISDFQVSGSYVVKMRFLDEDQSWSLFSKIVFREEGCPVELKRIGKKIIENCGGLPLSIVVIGGLLAKSQQSQEYWEYIAENLNSIVNSEDDESCLKILHMSYNELPVYLKPCFLYMGVFPEDFEIRVSKVVKLWVAEGFLKPISGKIWEEIAEEYLKELINRNLVLVHELGAIGNVKYCYVHDLLRDLCLKESQKQRFYNVIRQPSLDTPQDLSTQRRIVIPNSISQANTRKFISLARSLIYHYGEELSFHNFRLLRIMSRPYVDSTYFQFQLVNTRFIFLGLLNVHKFPSSLDLYWNLHTLTVNSYEELQTPFEIWNMSQLRHLEFNLGGLHLQYPPDGGEVGGQDGIIMENLHTLGKVINFKCCKEVVKRIPNIKKLRVSYTPREDGRDNGFNNFCHLQKLESLQCYCGIYDESNSLRNLIFPHSLKKLMLDVTEFHNWEDYLEKIGSLPCLEKLTLVDGCFKEGKWETVEGHFPKLKFLKIVFVKGLKYWVTESSHFPCLEHLSLFRLHELIEIPSEIGEIPTLESIRLHLCSDPIIFSAKKIQEEQEELYGEVGLQVRVLVFTYKKEDLQRLAAPNFHISYT